MSNIISMVSGQSLESHPLRASLHAASQSLPLSLSTPIATSVSVLPPLQPLLCSPAALHHATVWPRALGRALYIELATTCCSHVCSEQAHQDQVRILAIGNFTFSTLHLPRILTSQFMHPQYSAIFPMKECWNIETKLHNNRGYENIQMQIMRTLKPDGHLT